MVKIQKSGKICKKILKSFFFKKSKTFENIFCLAKKNAILLVF